MCAIRALVLSLSALTGLWVTSRLSTSIAVNQFQSVTLWMLGCLAVAAVTVVGWRGR